MNKKYAILMFAIILLAGCMPKKPIRIVNVNFPEVGVVVTRGIGEGLLTQGNGALVSNLVIPEDQTVGTFTLIKGTYTYTFENDSYIKFYRDHQDIFLHKIDNTICINKINKERCSSVKYSLEATIKNKSKDIFQQTLLYNGKVGNKVTFAYREFSNNMARPAFNNEVAYDLSETMVIGYKGARIEIIKATNTEITYKILSTFE